MTRAMAWLMSPTTARVSAASSRAVAASAVYSARAPAGSWAALSASSTDRAWREGGAAGESEQKKKKGNKKKT